ncbi:6895_t:CDS:2 [Entrophospora sp. SA101]|nr:6895_t:CDS:2 [Entrophospora sp. SA101]CAJ0831012.1 8093_t:CDS:2 [Entrophospora sp. SA101]
MTLTTEKNDNINRALIRTFVILNRLCISPDKRYLAAAGNQHIRLYDIVSTNPNPVATFEGHTGNVTAVGFHCEGKWMVSGTTSVQRNYDHKAPVNDVAIHPNQGELFSCDQKGSIRVWDLGENSCTHQLEPEEDVPLRSVTVAIDGSMFVAANNKGNCYVWKMSNPRDSTNLQPVTKFSAHKKYITRCLLSPDVKHLATCSADTTVKIWSTVNHDFKLDKELKGHQRWVWDSSSDHVARLWELQKGETIRQYNGHHKAAVCVALNDLSIGS